jgi:predicted DNA-binding transcriptional regulator AlpA
MANESAIADELLFDPSVHGSSPRSPLLSGFLRREELAQQLDVSIRTLDRWHTLRIGPPRVSVGRTILYRQDAVRDWLQSQELTPAFANTKKTSCRKRQLAN